MSKMRPSGGGFQKNGKHKIANNSVPVNFVKKVYKNIVVGDNTPYHFFYIHFLRRTNDNWTLWNMDRYLEFTVQVEVFEFIFIFSFFPCAVPWSSSSSRPCVLLIYTFGVACIWGSFDSLPFPAQALEVSIRTVHLRTRTFLGKFNDPCNTFQ